MRSTLLLSRLLTGILLIPLLGILLTGCRPSDGIREYTVENLPPTVKRDLSSASTEPAWFFKLTGPADEVLQQVVSFSQVVKSLQFEADGNPRYDLPEGWTVSNGPPPRYQTLKITPSKSPLEVTISSLPGPEQDFGGYLLSNLNRWREQLELEPYSSDDWLEKSRSSGELRLAQAGGRMLAMINLVGEMPEKGPSRILGAVVLALPSQPGNSPPGAEAAEESAQGKGDSPTTMSATKPALGYKVPQNWSESTGNAMRLASFKVPHDAGAADVSVTRILGGGDTLSNVNRWRGQVDLKPLTEAELKKDSKTLSIGGKEALLVTAAGKKESILAAIVPDGENKWFFKMQGPQATVTAETAHFEEFLKSIKFEKSE